NHLGGWGLTECRKLYHFYAEKISTLGLQRSTLDLQIEFCAAITPRVPPRKERRQALRLKASSDLFHHRRFFVSVLHDHELLRVISNGVQQNLVQSSGGSITDQLIDLSQIRNTAHHILKALLVSLIVRNEHNFRF